MIGAMIADYAFRAEYIPAPYDPKFDRFNLPRIIGTQAAMDTLTAIASAFRAPRPVRSACPAAPQPATRPR
jgi:hypothetical protein